MIETVLVMLIGVAFALAANALSPRGLKLTRNYFPGAEKPAAIAVATPALPNAAPASAAIPAVSPVDDTLRRLEERGLQLVNSNAVMELFKDLRYQQGLIVFVDARDDEHYSGGHIPGAWQFNHYRPEAHLPTVLPTCMIAQKVVVYCTGGHCEDSEFAAVMLRENGVPRENLFVYAGGITEWKALGRPVETGARQSGQLLKQ
ncbi:MAG: transcriptional regulator, ArsR family [Verrucomicrobiales bacterium]|nr:transcriptional regulator, ArsR family [Verrucomicrobiales bacterium]